MPGQRIGYVRVSSFDQNPERQLEQVPVDRLLPIKLRARTRGPSSNGTKTVKRQIIGSSGFVVGGGGYSGRRHSQKRMKRASYRGVTGRALERPVANCPIPFIPFPSYQLGVSDRPGAVKGAPTARRSEPLTTRTDLESLEGRERRFRSPATGLPTQNPEEPFKERTEGGETGDPDQESRGALGRLVTSVMPAGY